MPMMTPKVMVLPPPLPKLPTHISNSLFGVSTWIPKGLLNLKHNTCKTKLLVPTSSSLLQPSPSWKGGALFFQLLRLESFLLLLFLMPSNPSATPVGSPSIDPEADLFHCQHPDSNHNSAALFVSILTPIAHSSLRPLNSVSCQHPLLKTLQGLLFHLVKAQVFMVADEAPETDLLAALLTHPVPPHRLLAFPLP